MIQLALLALLELWFAVAVFMGAVETSDHAYGAAILTTSVLIVAYAGRVGSIILRSRNRGWQLPHYVWIVMLPIRIVLRRNRVVSKSEFATTPRYNAGESEFANWMRMLEITARST